MSKSTDLWPWTNSCAGAPVTWERGPLTSEGHIPLLPLPRLQGISWASVPILHKLDLTQTISKTNSWFMVKFVSKIVMLNKILMYRRSWWGDRRGDSVSGLIFVCFSIFVVLSYDYCRLLCALQCQYRVEQCNRSSIYWLLYRVTYFWGGITVTLWWLLSKFCRLLLLVTSLIPISSTWLHVSFHNLTLSPVTQT